MGNKFSMIDEPQFLFLAYLHSGHTLLYGLEVLLAYLHSGPTLLYGLEVLPGLLTFRTYSFIWPWGPSLPTHIQDLLFYMNLRSFLAYSHSGPTLPYDIQVLPRLLTILHFYMTLRSFLAYLHYYTLDLLLYMRYRSFLDSWHSGPILLYDFKILSGLLKFNTCMMIWKTQKEETSPI